jgi:hypothetical protein
MKPIVETVTEPYRTFKAVSEVTGLPVFKIRRAAKLGIFPTYTLFNKRRLVRLSEVVAAIERSHHG